MSSVVAGGYKGKDHRPIVARFKFRDGTTHEVDLMPSMKEKYLDEYIRDPLPIPEVADAVADELTWLNDEVWDGVWKHEVDIEQDALVVGTRWAACNKGDHHNPDVRMRLVAREVNTYKKEAYFAATPPGHYTSFFFCVCNISSGIDFGVFCWLHVNLNLVLSHKNGLSWMLP